MRNSKKIVARENSVGFSLRTFDANVVMADYIAEIDEINKHTDNMYKIVDGRRTADPEELKEARNAYTKLIATVDKLNNTPIRVKETYGKVSRMSRSIGSDIFGIDYESHRPTTQWITVEHAVQEIFSFPYVVMSPNRKEAEEVLENLQKKIMYRIGNAGVIVIGRDGKENLYKGFASSASHQKNEKIVMALAESLDRHEKAIWFTLSLQNVLDLTVNGAAIWKMRANLLRPIRKQLRTADGKALTLNDIQLVPDITVTRHIENCRTVGILNPETQEIFEDAPMDLEKTMADGTFLSTVALEQWGQLCGYGMKGCVVDGTSSIATAAKLENKETPAGLKALIAGEGTWKFDKIGCSFDEFVARANEMAKEYPSINKLYLLREGDELEGEVKIRRLTRSLIQQWIHMDAADIRKMTAPSRKALRRMKTMQGAINSLSELGKPESERSDVAKVFAAAPWLVLNPMVQKHLQTRFEKKRNEAAANKIRTSGSYPYIQEDTVAVAQIWVFGADANRMDLGVLAADEISVADTAERKILAVRFPANYQTAAVRMNRPCEEAFASCPGVCQISFYDDILIRQDGDVDGDEMAIILDDLAIEATEKMYAEFNPPVVNFAHGDKAKKEVIGTTDRLTTTMYDDLWKAKKFDGVGKYANLATLCCHLASVAYQEGRMDDVRVHLNQCSLASTGAILAIDQVKGNSVSPALIDRLEKIGRQVRGMCDHKMPYTQQFVKGLAADQCMEESVSICDQIAGLVMRDAGEFELETGNAVWDKVEAKRALLSFGDYRVTSVRRAPVCGTVLNKLADNWFNEKSDADKKTFDAIRNGESVSQKDLLVLLWRNACALEFRMEGENLVAKRREYLKTVREMLYTQACSTQWIGADGHVFSDTEKKFSVVNAAVSDALCLTAKNNGIDSNKQGSYAMFVLRVFAKEILWSLQRSNPDSSKFVSDADTDISFEDAIDEELYSDECGIVECDIDDISDDFDSEEFC